MRSWGEMKDRHLRVNDETVVVPTVPYSFEPRQPCVACGEIPHICRVCERGSLGPVLKLRLAMGLSLVAALVFVALTCWVYFFTGLSLVATLWLGAFAGAFAVLFELNRYSLSRHYKRIQ